MTKTYSAAGVVVLPVARYINTKKNKISLSSNVVGLQRFLNLTPFDSWDVV